MEDVNHKANIIHFLLPFFFLLYFISINPFFPPPLACAQLLPIIDDVSMGNATRLQTYVVHVLKPNNTNFLTDEDREDWHRSFLPSTLLDSGEPRLIYSYKHAISGFAARLTPEEVMAMKSSMNGLILDAFPEQLYELQTTYTPTLLGLNENQGLWPASNFGEGIIIGVIDSGILPTHPSFDDAGMPPRPSKWRGRCDFGTGGCNNKIIGARAFLGGQPASPLDDVGHGTHTASTAAGGLVQNANVLGQAYGNAVGMAPKAHLAIYKVLFSGRGGEADFLAGIDQAIDDGVDVLSMSIGLPLPTPLFQSSIHIASMAAIERGIVPSAAAGNSGPTPGSVINDAPWVLTVGAATTGRSILSTVQLGNGLLVLGESAYQPPQWVPYMMQIVYPGADSIADAFRFCAPSALAMLNLLGKIVLCWSGGFNDVDIGKFVANAGGAALIILNSPEKALTIEAAAHVLPASHVNSIGTQAILLYCTSSLLPTATIVFQGTQIGLAMAPAASVASFSSRGPSLNNGGILKPDIVGPGVNILAAWNVQVGPVAPLSPLTFNFESGTSMATPHLSGISALLKALHPYWSPAAIKSAIMTTAYTHHTTDGTPYRDQYPDSAPIASYYAIGAGHVNVVNAPDPGLIYDIDASDYVSYLCGLPGYTDNQVSMIIRRPIQCASFPIISPEQLNYPSISLTLSPGSSKFIIRTVTNVGEPNSVYTVQVGMGQLGIVSALFNPARLSFSSVNERKSFGIGFQVVTYPGFGLVLEGQVLLVSNTHVVRSPISITFN